MLTRFLNYIRLLQLAFVNIIKNSLSFQLLRIKEVKLNCINSHESVHRPLFQSMPDKSDDCSRF